MSTSSAHPTSTRCEQTDWEVHRTKIINLYQNENKTLDEVQKVMSDQGFDASLAMYKKRLRKWGVNKNLKNSDVCFAMRAIENRKSQGKLTSIKIRGRVVSEKEILRHAQRARLVSADIQNIREWDESDSAEHVRASTPDSGADEVLAVNKTPRKRRRVVKKAESASIVDQETDQSVVSTRLGTCQRQQSSRPYSPKLSNSRHEQNRFDLSPFFCFDPYDNDILSCLDPKQETLVCLQIYLQEFRLPTQRISGEGRLSIRARAALNYGRLVDGETTLDALQSSLKDRQAELSKLDACTVLDLLEPMLNLSLSETTEQFTSSFLNGLYDTSDNLYGQLHPLTRLLAKISQNLSKDVLIQAFLDTTSHLSGFQPTTVMQVLQIYGLLTEKYGATGLVSGEFGSLVEKVMRVITERRKYLSPFVFMGSDYAEANRFLDQWAISVHTVPGEAPEFEDIWLRTLRAALLCEKERYEDAAIMFQGAWNIAQNCRTHKHQAKTYVASLCELYGFSNPFGGLIYAVAPKNGDIEPGGADSTGTFQHESTNVDDQTHQWVTRMVGEPQNV